MMPPLVLFPVAFLIFADMSIKFPRTSNTNTVVLILIRSSHYKWHRRQQYLHLLYIFRVGLVFADWESIYLTKTCHSPWARGMYWTLYTRCRSRSATCHVTFNSPRQPLVFSQCHKMALLLPCVIFLWARDYTYMHADDICRRTIILRNMCSLKIDF